MWIDFSLLYCTYIILEFSITPKSAFNTYLSGMQGWDEAVGQGSLVNKCP